MKKTSIGSRILALNADREALLKERAATLRTLHSDLGFISKADLIAALSESEKDAVASPTTVRVATSLKQGKKAKKKTTPKARAKAKAKPVAKVAAVAPVENKERKNRVRITEELRSSIIAALTTGATDIAIAKKFGVSRPTVQNIKRAAGMTRSRSKDTEGTVAEAAALVEAASTTTATEEPAAASA